LLADPLLYLTIYKVLGNAIRPQLGTAFLATGSIAPVARVDAQSRSPLAALALDEKMVQTVAS